MMNKVIKATGDGACLFNAVAIGFTIELLSGGLDAQQNSRGYQLLLEEFAKHHPNFRPKSWENLKQWLTFYNDSRDIELILAPVLFKLHQQYQTKTEADIVYELVEIVFNNKEDIIKKEPWFQLKVIGEYGNSLCPKIDSLSLETRNQLIGSLKTKLDRDKVALERDKVILDRKKLKEYIKEQAKDIITDLKEKIHSNEDAFKQGYSCDNLKEMTDALALSLIENGAGGSLAKNNKIYLQNEEQHWNVECSDIHYGRFINAQPKRLNITSNQAYRGEVAVPHPINPMASTKPQVNITAEDSDFKQPKHAIQMNQNCAEVMLIKAAELVLEKKIEFQYDNVVDAQIDIGPAFMYSPDEEKQYWTSGSAQNNLQNDLESKLKKNKVYLLRTGTNGGAGHWQTLYFDQSKNGWITFSTETNNYQITKNKFLTEEGINLLRPFATWGYGAGQYSFLVVEASKQNLINAANYLYDYRVHGEDRAQENLSIVSNESKFHKEILVKDLQAVITKEAPKKATVKEVVAPQCRQAEKQQRKLEERQIAEQDINIYVNQINKFAVDFSGVTTIENVQKRQKELVEELTVIRNNRDISKALSILEIDYSPKINEAISNKTQEINSIAQGLRKNIEEDQRQRREEELQRSHLEDERQRKLEQQKLKLQKEQQKLEQRQDAEQIINTYEEQIKKLAVDFSGATTVELVQQQKSALLEKLTGITRNKNDLSQALKTLERNQSPKLSEAIFNKTQEINTIAQQLQRSIEMTQRQRREEELQRSHLEDERQRKLEQQKLKLQKEQQKLMDRYVQQIRQLAVTYTNVATVADVQTRRDVLHSQLNEFLASGKTEVSNALATLKINESNSPIAQEIAVKRQDIDAQAQQLYQRINEELRQRQTEEQKKAQAQVLMDRYVQQIRQLAVTYTNVATVADVQTRRDVLHSQLNEFLASGKTEVSNALATLKINESNSPIAQAIAVKRQDIDAQAQQLYQRINEELRQRQTEEQKKAQANEVIEKQQQEEQLKAQQKHQAFVTQTISDIDSILGTLRDRIDQIDPNFSEAGEKADGLLQALETARDNYRESLQDPLNDKESAKQEFKGACRAAIEDAMEVLERDLDWRDYLKNLLKKLVNAIVSPFRPGQTSLFALKRADSAAAAERAGEDLENDGPAP